MQDMRLVELVNKAREEAHRDVQALRAEVREDLNAMRAETAALLRKLVWGVVVLGLALGGKDVLELVFR
jgi:hypothetical protein